MTDNNSDAISSYTQQNRRAWNEIAGVREKTFPQADFFAGGGSTLDGRVVEAVRQVFGQAAGLRVLHLQCATGEDSLSWAVLGARAIGVDIAEAQIELARQKAAAANLVVDFYTADIYDLPAELCRASFDVVFTGGGALVWLPDLARWASVVAACLKPGGRLILSEEHPLASCLWVEEGRLVLEEDYFARGRAYAGVGWQHFKGGEGAKETKYEFVWPLGDVVTAVASAGLVIERLEEFPGGPEWRFGDQQKVMDRLPGEFLMVARKC
jgi:SAM-dependent methyltransferase